jgi:hypothetical protein
MTDDKFTLRREPVLIGGAFGAAALFPEFIRAALDMLVTQFQSLGVVF